MPTYEYECRGCSTRFEAIQKMTDDALTTCESCGGSLRKLLFPVGIVFKGSGFYVTDYKNKENGSNGSSRGVSSSDSTSNGTEKSESTSASTSDSGSSTKSDTSSSTKSEATASKA